jgi:ATP-dependent RNA helicase SUPV3L1/SUV3
LLRKRGIKHAQHRGLLSWRIRGELPVSALPYYFEFTAKGSPGDLDADQLDASLAALLPEGSKPVEEVAKIGLFVTQCLDWARANAGGTPDELSRAFRRILSGGKSPSRAHYDLSARFNQWREVTMETRRTASIEEALGLTDYPAIFDEARLLRRHFHLLVGPTNSGKTHQALNALAQAKSGAYLAPLRLLALEGQEALFERGTLASLITGEERQILPNATHTASTVEMADFWKPLDCAVIDEAQMLTDPDRGWAWTAAICGIPAKEVYLVGAPELIDNVIPLLQKLGDTWEVHKFERKGPLSVEEVPCPLRALQPGDAVIAFSRRDVLSLREDLKRHGKTVAVVYGALTPEVRRAEARRFSSGAADVLVATDAIGMGLNLPIRRIVFSTATKFDGSSDRSLSRGEVLQIAGRAGRYGLTPEGGLVTALDAATLTRIRSLFNSPALPQGSQKVAIAPNPAHVVQIAKLLGTQSLGTVLEFFRAKLVQQDPLFRTAELEDSVRLAWLSDGVKGMDLETRFSYACAPLDRKSELHMQCYFRWLHAHAKGQTCRLPDLPNWVYLGPAEAWLYEAEGLTKLASVYSWLAYRFPEVYPDIDRAARQRAELSAYIESVLARKGKFSQNFLRKHPNSV